MNSTGGAVCGARSFFAQSSDTKAESFTVVEDWLLEACPSDNARLMFLAVLRIWKAVNRIGLIEEDRKYRPIALPYGTRIFGQRWGSARFSKTLRELEGAGLVALGRNRAGVTEVSVTLTGIERKPAELHVLPKQLELDFESTAARSVFRSERHSNTSLLPKSSSGSVDLRKPKRNDRAHGLTPSATRRITRIPNQADSLHAIERRFSGPCTESATAYMSLDRDWQNDPPDLPTLDTWATRLCGERCHGLEALSDVYFSQERLTELVDCLIDFEIDSVSGAGFRRPAAVLVWRLRAGLTAERAS